MNLLFCATALALSMGAAALPRGAAPTADATKHLEVVFAPDTTLCAGCVPSYTDTMEDPTGFDASYTCPNGGAWYFTVYTPILRSASCMPTNAGCFPSGVCQFTRLGYLSYVGNSQASCPMFAKRKGEDGFTQVDNNDMFVIDLAVTCQSGTILALDCDRDWIEFYDQPDAEDGTVLMAWDVEFCCNRCPS